MTPPSVGSDNDIDIDIDTVIVGMAQSSPNYITSAIRL
jgi:hypothetical protein